MVAETKLPRLVVMDDERDISEFVRDVAELIGFEVAVPQSAEAFRHTVREFAPTLILLDLHIPQVDSVELLRQLAHDRISTPIVLMSGSGRHVLDYTSRLGQKHGLDVVDVLQKPIRLAEIRALLERHDSGSTLPRVTSGSPARRRTS